MRKAPKWAKRFDWAAYDRDNGTSIHRAVNVIKPSIEAYVARVIGQQISHQQARLLHKLSKRKKISKKLTARLSMDERNWLVALMEAHQQGGYLAHCKKITHQW